ncbi:MAG: protein kinase [Pyrinomonadaceae bacterium]|nr:protein kinase [Pyrinomonadaceae bacterium]MBP6213414.1 protein kinase [Pyrinomonadaceae bacterium]
MKPLAPNTMIQGRYLVVHLIGKGGMGEVYLAVDQRLGSAVALKRTSFADDAQLAAAFEREAKILARLRHPVLPKVSDHFAENGEQYLVMEHISGDDLSKRLENANKPFPVSWVMFWADQLLDALSYLHSHEPPIIHRDIKPQNLKLTDENHIVLLDFGLSKDTANKSVVSKPGTSGSVVGYTPHFAPMEQIRGTGTNPRSDIYSLSATLYQLMTDTVPPDALSRADSMLNSKGDPIEPISNLNPEVSPAVSNVILKGLEVSQDKRFSTASEMQKALRGAYAQIQTDMSAATVIFNASDNVVGDVHMTSPPINTHAPVAPSEMATRIDSVPSLGRADEGSSAPITAAEQAAMEATIQMDAAELQPEIRQADVMTEVFLGADSPVAAAIPPSPFMDNVAQSTEPEPVPTFEPAATVPLANINEDFGRSPEEPTTPEFFETAASVTVPEPVRSEPIAPAPVTAPAAAKASVAGASKGKSKTGLIVGGLIAVVLLGVIAAVGGYFVYTNYLGGAKPTPSPTPTVAASPSPSASPSPTPTPEETPTPMSNTNTDVNSSVTVEPTPVPTQGTSIPGTRPTPQVQTQRTPGTKPPATPGTKVTPKPKPNNDRTVIEQ